MSAVAPTIGKSASAQNSQLSQLEHQTATTIRADKKSSARPNEGHSQIAHSHSSEHGSSINFTYHPPQIPQGGAKNTASASSGRRH